MVLTVVDMFIDIFILCTILFGVYVTPNPGKSYGSFNLTISSFETCKGPKHKDCATASAIQNSYNSIKYELNVTESLSPTKGKIIAFTNGKELLRLQMNRPCEHLFLRPLFQSLMNVTKDCIVLKGHYRINIDLLKIAQTYYDGSFLFGNWTFKSTFFNNDCNLSCSIVKVQMSPKSKEH